MSEFTIPSRRSTVESKRSVEMNRVQALPTTTGRPNRFNLAAIWRWTRHLGEMLVAMFLGMMVLGLATTAFGNPPGDNTVLGGYAYMGLAMTLPMVAWMRRMGHPWKDCAEMSAAMLGPMFAVVLPAALGTVDAMSVMLLAHGAMIGGMILLMVYRWDVYALGMHCHHGAALESKGDRAASVTDPVCGMPVNPATATLTAEYQGHTYHFCSAGCQQDFAENLAGFAATSAGTAH
jgi:YHS domain-containing protein